MGESKVSRMKDKRSMKKFVRSLLTDVEALQHMIENNWIEDDIVRIGAEQEMCIVDQKTLKPRPIAMKVLKALGDQDFVETELAQFNLETGMTPQEFSGTCLSDMEKENLEMISKIREVLNEFGASPLLTGILPTLNKHNLDMKYLTPMKRYKALMDALNDHRMGEAYELKLSGIDELTLKHDSPFLEACNTSFQVHLQVNARDFAQKYNISQLLAGPVIALASNSPIVFGRRLWHESRIALFQQAIDTRTTSEHMRERLPRVNFGSQWMENSVLEIYKEDIARFRVLLAADIEENSLKEISNDRVPYLRALQVHNGTVYRWNRGCYGISDTGKPHLRIENRVLAAGPTVVDEIANAAVWLGAMEGYYLNDLKVSEKFDFSDARDNFGKAAKYGLETNFRWMTKSNIPASELVLKEIIPIAREGLESRNVDSGDIDKYLGIIEERVSVQKNGASWLMGNYTNLLHSMSKDEALTVLTSSMLKQHEKEKPVHLWEDSDAYDLDIYRMAGLRVEEFMETDVFSVHPDDIVELVAEMMDWNMFRYVPVENKAGELVGLITGRILLRHYIKLHKSGSRKSYYIKDIMISKPITIKPTDSVMDALHIMKSKQVGCLPVVLNEELVGMITESNFLRVSGRLIERLYEDGKLG